jgi:crossover junction endodeoxyribonuclease RusA
MMLRIELPWPHRDLSPNRARNVHWSKKSKAVREYRRQAAWDALRVIPADQRGKWQGTGDIPMTVTFCPPDGIRRDRDNMQASFKAGFDGIADAMDVDDNRFVPTFRLGERIKGGKVIVEIA